LRPRCRMTLDWLTVCWDLPGVIGAQGVQMSP